MNAWWLENCKALFFFSETPTSKVRLTARLFLMTALVLNTTDLNQPSCLLWWRLW